MKKTNIHAFSLLEIMIVAAIVIIMSTSVITAIPARIRSAQRAAEQKSMDALVADITRSFESTDYEDRNIAGITGDLASGQIGTAFTGVLGAPVTTATNDWFAKLARVRGLSPVVGVAPSRSAQPELARIVYNDRGQPRYLFLDPMPSFLTPDYRRFILCTILDDGVLTFPSPGAGTFANKVSSFEALWATDFDSSINVLPAYWTTALTADQQAVWLDGQGDGSNLQRMVIRRITLARHKVTVNNNHTTANAYVSWTTDGSVTPDLTVAAGVGTVVSSGILEGRHISVRFGTTFASSVLKYQIVLRKDVTFTVE